MRNDWYICLEDNESRLREFNQGFDFIINLVGVHVNMEVYTSLTPPQSLRCSFKRRPTHAWGRPCTNRTSTWYRNNQKVILNITDRIYPRIPLNDWVNNQQNKKICIRNKNCYLLSKSWRGQIYFTRDKWCSRGNKKAPNYSPIQLKWLSPPICVFDPFQIRGSRLQRPEISEQKQ